MGVFFMNALWAGMMLMAIIYGTFHGTIPAVTQAALDSAKEAVSLCITMLGILSFWMGLMQVGSASGLIGRMTRGIRPVLRWLFPRIPEDHPAGVAAQPSPNTFAIQLTAICSNAG